MTVTIDMKSLAAAAAVLAVLGAGYRVFFHHGAPSEANDATCTLETVEKISDKDERQEFGTKCAIRGTYRPSTPRSW